MAARLPGLPARARRPVASPASLGRAALERMLGDAASQRRLTVLVAGAGYGKTTLLSRVADRRRSAWYGIDARDRDPGVLASGIANALVEVLPGFESDLDELARSPSPVSEAEGRERAIGIAQRLVDAIEAAGIARLARKSQDGVMLVLDDAHELGEAGPAWAFLETMVRVASPALHIVLGSRAEPPMALERMRGQGEVLDLGGPDLAFSKDEVEAVLARALAAAPEEPDELPRIAAAVFDMTGGWPAAVRLASEALRATPPGTRAAAVGRLREPSGPLFAYLAEEVIAVASEPVRELLRRMAPFDRFSAAMCEALGVPDAERTLGGLARRALFLQPIAGEQGWFELHALVREYVQRHLPLEPSELVEEHRRAAAWYAAAGMPEAALRAHVAAGDRGALRAFLQDSGVSLVARGGGRAVADAIGSVPEVERTTDLELLLAEACLASGEWSTAAGALRRVAGTADRLPAAVAWRLGLIDGLRGRYDEALAVYRRADPAGASPDDETFLFAYMASAHRHRGDIVETGEAARRALEAAERSGGQRALAAAYVAVGQAHQLASDLPASLEAYERALVAAEAAGDAVQRVRIHTAMGTLCLDIGRLERANAQLDEAVALATAIGFASFQARALAERSRTRWWLGKVEEAFADVAAARDLYARLDSPGRLFALLDEGELHIYRGDRGAARTLLESAVRAARESSDLLLAVCLAELAESVAEEDPERATALLDEAEALEAITPHVQTKTVIAFAHLALGNAARVIALATEIEVLASRSGYLPQVGHARELRAHATQDPAEARRLFASALPIWTDLGAPVGIARNRLRFAQVATGAEARAAAEEARAALQALGARSLAAEAAQRLAELDHAARPEVAIRTLGGFAVYRGGHVVPTNEWRSKKARDLLKIVAARRGRPVPREQLYDLLWPDEDPEPLANRLSVALATVRAVLDPDRLHPSDQFVGADRGSVWLDLEHVELDLARFLDHVAEARRLRRAGRDADAREAFERAEAEYQGEFLEEDPYEGFAEGPREEAQAAYMDAAREVAREALARHDADTAIRIQLRILEIDAFDERAHSSLIAALIAAGRHGEARRRYAIYVARMSELGVDAGSFPMPATAPVDAAPNTSPRSSRALSR